MRKNQHSARPFSIEIAIVTLKNGKKNPRTVYQMACRKVRQYIYQNKSIENNGKYVYIEDLKNLKNGEDTSENALDREYIRMKKYVSITTYYDHKKYSEFVNKLNLTPKQKEILTLRFRGLGVTEIASKFNVSKPTISKQLKSIQVKVMNEYPELIKGFDLDKWN